MRINKKNFKNEIRIIGGIWKNYRIYIHKDVKPTKNIIRETLFNWLNPIIENSVCLDAFAGSGALGIESVSRGAKKAMLLEIDKKVGLQLKKNIQKFKSIKIKCIISNVFYWILKKNEKFDIVFLDPPFNNLSQINSIIVCLENFRYFNKNAWIYVETSRFNKSYVVPSFWEKYKEKIIGNVLFRLYKRNI